MSASHKSLCWSPQATCKFMFESLCDHYSPKMVRSWSVLGAEEKEVETENVLFGNFGLYMVEASNKNRTLAIWRGNFF